MASNQHNLNQVCINEIFRLLQNFFVKNNDIHGKPLKVKYNNVSLFSINKSHSTLTK